MIYDCSGKTKEDVLDNFVHGINSKLMTVAENKSKGSAVSFKWHDRVDGNPRAAYTEAHPYVGRATITGRVGVNGKIGGGGMHGD